MTNPEILTHPNIPKPLHGMNPRSILGKEWWDEKRREAYAKRDFHCWACGVHKAFAKYHKWLEGHESYDINYNTGRVELVEIVALCHSCHNFIHSGRMSILEIKGEMEVEKIKDILLHGFRILKQANLKPFWFTAALWLMLDGYDEEEALLTVIDQGIDPYTKDGSCGWSDWHLVIDGKKYYTKYENQEAWAEAYA